MIHSLFFPLLSVNNFNVCDPINIEKNSNNQFEIMISLFYKRQIIHITSLQAYACNDVM